MLSKKEAVKKIAALTKQGAALFEEANKVAKASGIDDFVSGYSGDYDSEELEKLDPKGNLYTLQKWNTSTC